MLVNGYITSMINVIKVCIDLGHRLPLCIWKFLYKSQLLLFTDVDADVYATN